MLEPIGIEIGRRLEVEHWITAPDIEALAVAAAVLDKVVTGPAISVTFWNINGSQRPIETGGRWLIRESQGIVGELMVQYVIPLLSSKLRLQVSEIRSPTHAKSCPLMWFGLDSSAFIPVEAPLYIQCKREIKIKYWIFRHNVWWTWKVMQLKGEQYCCCPIIFELLEKN